MKKSDGDKPADAKAFANALLWMLNVLGLPLRHLRRGIGPRAHSLVEKVVSLAVMEVFILGCGGGDWRVVRPVELALALIVFAQPLAFRNLRRQGFHYPTHGIGVSIPEHLFKCGEGVGKKILEPLMFAVVAWGFALIKQPGLAAFFLVGGSLCGVIDYLIVARKERFADDSVLDSRIEAGRRAYAASSYQGDER